MFVCFFFLISRFRSTSHNNPFKILFLEPLQSTFQQIISIWNSFLLMNCRRKNNLYKKCEWDLFSTKITNHIKKNIGTTWTVNQLQIMRKTVKKYKVLIGMFYWPVFSFHSNPREREKSIENYQKILHMNTVSNFSIVSNKKIRIANERFFSLNKMCIFHKLLIANNKVQHTWIRRLS